jgi:hypothetical protein
MLLLLLSLAAVAPPPYAGRDDCAMYVTIHRERFGSRNATDHGVALKISGPDGRNLSCPDWKQWDAAPTEVIVFDEPVLTEDLEHAGVTYTVLAYNHHWDVGRVTGRESFRCELEPLANSWRITHCEAVARD